MNDEIEAPFQAHSLTSRRAAESIEASAGTLRAQCLADLKRMGATGATDEEQQIRLGMNPSTQRPRRIELVERGLVCDSGAKRMTRASRNAVVWVCTEYLLLEDE